MISRARAASHPRPLSRISLWRRFIPLAPSISRSRISQGWRRDLGKRIWGSLGRDHGPYAGVSEELQEQVVLPVAVQDMGIGDAVLHGPEACRDLGIIPPETVPSSIMWSSSVAGEPPEDLPAVAVHDTVHVRQVDQLVGVQRDGDLPAAVSH